MSYSAARPPQKPSRVDPNTVYRAVKSLRKWWNSESMTQKARPMEHDGFMYLIVALTKVPQKDRTNPEMIPLPHPFIDLVEDSPEFCLIIDDRSKNHITKEAAMKKIEAEKLPISDVIKISKFKSDYRTVESKRKLCDSYDMYFAEKRVMPILPKLFGKQFVKKKKMLVPIDKNKNWKDQIETACGSTLFFMGTGTCSVVKVAKLSMGNKEIAENVVAAISGVVDVVPRKWKNVKSIHLKLLESLALPVYQSVPDLDLKVDASNEEN
ncbi:PREDICTED: ribosomal L1 domain-containing protein 1 isoform X3 [Tarenaya hassleriana]|uniref:ribosomal L1 domain-containing protein 1 isoform X1 n=1 Tax=Tarenaya hassleriana TaxID=28532 RepID=UPI00053C5DE1|nr:PREDICTED: ribosomal L1 domain-containing protein 1 isoform X1 [Tarenaya hassleriana]XP_010522089.1 PREDICTED: ribosomal L1 domain-containing protein 1 isoform X3 [Tarenaya hassleriana]